MEWNGGVDYWSGVLDWSTGVPRPQIGNLIRSAVATTSIFSVVKLAVIVVHTITWSYYRLYMVLPHSRSYAASMTDDTQ